MNSKTDDKQEPIADSWEQLTDDTSKSQTNPGNGEGAQEGDKKPRKKLQLKKENVFVSNPDSKDSFGEFFKEEIEAFLKAKSGRMFQSISVPKVPVTKTFTTAKNTATTKQETKKGPTETKESPSKEERKEKEASAQEANKKKSML